MIPAIILTATTKDNKGTYEEFFAWQELIDILDESGRYWTEVEGSYKGDTEAAAMLSSTDIDQWLEVAKKFNQESILFVDNVGKAMLIYTNGTSEPIGHWEAVPERVAFNHDSWTKDGDQYYICL